MELRLKRLGKTFMHLGIEAFMKISHKRIGSITRLDYRSPGICSIRFEDFTIFFADDCH